MVVAFRDGRRRSRRRHRLTANPEGRSKPLSQRRADLVEELVSAEEQQHVRFRMNIKRRHRASWKP